MRYPPGGDRFQGCLQTRCVSALQSGKLLNPAETLLIGSLLAQRTECYGGLLYKVQYSEAKGRCVQKGLEFGDIEFQTCVKESLVWKHSTYTKQQATDTHSPCPLGRNDPGELSLLDAVCRYRVLLHWRQLYTRRIRIPGLRRDFFRTLTSPFPFLLRSRRSFKYFGSFCKWLMNLAGRHMLR